MHPCALAVRVLCEVFRLSCLSGLPKQECRTPETVPSCLLPVAAETPDQIWLACIRSDFARYSYCGVVSFSEVSGADLSV